MKHANAERRFDDAHPDTCSEVQSKTRYVQPKMRNLQTTPYHDNESLTKYGIIIRNIQRRW